MADLQSQFDHLDKLLTELERALADQDWSQLSRLNECVRPAVEPLMAALEAGEVEAEPVRTRLEELQQFVDVANRQATQARAEAEQALKGVTRNRSAAKAYQNVSSTRPK